MPRIARALELVLAIAVAGALPAAGAQRPAAPDTSARAGAPDPAVAMAVRATSTPAIDGRDADAVWRTAPPITAFRQFEPAEDAEPSERTEARVAYDDRNLYVLVRAFDPHPDSIRSQLGRRDAETTADKIRIIIDAWHDRRSGVEMDVNPAGVRRDAAMYDDVEEDLSWDGVWDVATSVDSLGWIAEFAIPLSQLRFAPGPSLTFGFGVWREIARRNEVVSWPVYRPSRQAHVSQMGTLGGLVGLAAPRRLELLPYAVARSATERLPDRWGSDESVSGGLDLKYGLTSTLTVDATVNPDFGQVEADPSVLNLTAFETRFEERRPFFLEGVGLFRCGGPCEGIFYTRRIGRAPQLRRDDRDPAGTTILGAAKLTGRVGRGFSVGVIEAVTAREEGVGGGVVEPLTNYTVGRAYQELRGGRSGAGVMVTAVHRDLDSASALVLRREAYTALVQGFHRFAREQYEIMGYVGLNTVRGSREAIAATQLNPVHYYQRPDHDRAFDPARTSLAGAVKALRLRKLGGTATFGTFLRHADPGVELNDLGFVPLVNDVSITNDATLRTSRPGRGYRQLIGRFFSENHWTTGGLPAGSAAELAGEIVLPNSWSVEAAAGARNFVASHCVSCARGGPAVRLSPLVGGSIEIDGDERRMISPRLEIEARRGDEGRSSAAEVELSAALRLSSRLSLEIGGGAERLIEAAQWVANVPDPVTAGLVHYTFARMEQTTVAMTIRAGYAMTSTLSLQLYTQPFVSAGRFTDWRELAAPRARRFGDRYAPYGGGAVPDGFNVKEFNSNVVARWEYRPGSTLFVVWQQGREQDDRDPGSFELGRDYRNLFRAHPYNTLLVKASWWFAP